MIDCSKRCRQSRRGNNYAPHGRAHEPREIQKVRYNLPIYIFSGSDDQVGQRLEGVRVLIDRYRSAGLTIFRWPSRNLHEVNRRDVMVDLLVWISGIVESASG
jgi:hypothetical protein